MKLEIWSLGKANEDYIQRGLEVYFKKIKPYQPIGLRLLHHKLPGSAGVVSVKNAEADIVLQQLPAHAYLILLDERGTQYSSPQWASQLQMVMNRGAKHCVFLIGGAFGVSDKVKHRANECWSLGAIVMPHQLVRLVLAEQLYRAYSILHHSSYHHA